MRAFVLSLVLLPSIAIADAYVCQKANGTRSFSSSPCPPGESTVRSTPSPATGQPSHPTDYGAQLRQIQQNRADLDARRVADSEPSYSAPSQAPMTDAGKRSQCQYLRSQIDGIDAQLNMDWKARSMSPAEQRQQLRDRKQELQQERLSLGC